MPGQDEGGVGVAQLFHSCPRGCAGHKKSFNELFNVAVFLLKLETKNLTKFPVFKGTPDNACLKTVKGRINRQERAEGD